MRSTLHALLVMLAFLASIDLAPAAPAQLPEVPNLGWCNGQPDCLAWDAVAGAAKYRLYRGEGASLPCVLTGSLDSCVAGIYPVNVTGAVLTEVPLPGSMFWYLVVAVDGSGEGSPGNASAGPRTLNDNGSCAPACAPVGTACGTGADCCSGSCNGTCASNCCAPVNAACAIDPDCCSGLCVAGTCSGSCTTASDCPGADTDCSVRTCTAGQCGVSYTVAGTPTSGQQAGDCQVRVCDGSGGVVAQADNSDLPDDGNQCTNDSCVNGVPTNMPAPINLACTQNGGAVCDGNGRCVECTMAAQCPGSDTGCAQRSCTQNVCGTTYAPFGSPTPNQVAGDCVQEQCDGAGNTISAIDPFDIPNDGNQCTGDTCLGGVPSFPAAPMDSACSQNGGVVCDGMGNCVSCNYASQCPGVDTACQSRSCTFNTCGMTYAASGTPAGTQVPGDCQQAQCDGAGGVISVPDANDTPSDGNQCTSDTCVNGTPSFPPLPSGMACSQNGGVVCDGMGSCVQCNVASQCPGIDTQCQYRTCTANTCGMGYAPSGTACTENGGTACDGAGNCVTVPQVVATTPADGASAIASTSIAVTFSVAMSPATLTAQTSAGACGGSIQLSLDNFASCVGFAAPAPAMSNGDTLATLVPQPGLLVGRGYRVRVTTAAQSAFGIPLAAPYTQASGFSTFSPNLCDGSLVISQAYGAGGLSGASYRNDFVELHNRGGSAVNVSAMSIQYASSTGTTWLKTNLTGTIAAGGYYLVQLFSGGSNGAALPTPDATGVTDISGSNGKLALASNQAVLTGSCPTGGAVIDFVGYGPSANCSEGSSPTASPSTTTSVNRAQAGCQDNNVNGTDFATAAPQPRNGATAPSVCSCLVRNETGAAQEADFCDVQFPPTLSVQTGSSTGPIYGQVYEAGVTDPAGAAGVVRAQLGWGPATANPQYQPGWTWTGAAFNIQSGNNDEYQASFTAPAAGSYRYVYRFSVDSGVSWTYCDTTAGDGGAGSNAGLTFDLANQGVLTVTP